MHPYVHNAPPLDEDLHEEPHDPVFERVTEDPRARQPGENRAEHRARLRGKRPRDPLLDYGNGRHGRACDLVKLTR